MKNQTKILLSAGALLLVAAGALWLVSGSRGDAGPESAGKPLRYSARERKSGADRDGKSTAVRVPVRTAVKTSSFDGWGDDPFSESPAFDFDEEKDAQISDELKGILGDLNRAISSFNPDRKAVYAAVQRLLATIYAGKGDTIPRFAKIQAIDALKVIGAGGIAEMVGFLGDSDEVVEKSAADALMEQLIDFDVTEAQQLAIIQQLVKVNLSPENYESIAFTISSFKNANKVKAALAIYDSGTDGAMAALANNVDFIFDEAEAESIRTRDDIVKYGKEHPTDDADFEIESVK